MKKNEGENHFLHRITSDGWGHLKMWGEKKAQNVCLKTSQERERELFNLQEN